MLGFFSYPCSFFKSTCSFFKTEKKENSLLNGINQTIKLIASYNLKLIAVSLAFAYLHDYNIVLLYALAGVAFHKQIKKISQTVQAIFNAGSLIIHSSLNPLMQWKLFNFRILNYPIKGMIAFSCVFSFLFLKPISLLATEAFCALNCGADIARTSLKISKNFNNNCADKQSVQKTAVLGLDKLEKIKSIHIYYKQ